MENYTTEDIEKELISKLSGKKTYYTLSDINSVLIYFLGSNFIIKESWKVQSRTALVYYKNRYCFTIKFKTMRKSESRGSFYTESVNYFTNNFKVTFKDDVSNLKTICEEIDRQIIEERAEKQKFNSYITRIGIKLIEDNGISNKYDFIKIAQALNALSGSIWEDSQNK